MFQLIGEFKKFDDTDQEVDEVGVVLGQVDALTRDLENSGYKWAQ